MCVCVCACVDGCEPCVDGCVLINLRKIIPILDIVAGEAHDRSCDSNRKFTFGPNWILSPDGMVSNLHRQTHKLSMCVHLTY